MAWILARSRMKLAYEKMAAKTALLDASALSWLQNVGRENGREHFCYA